MKQLETSIVTSGVTRNSGTLVDKFFFFFFFFFFFLSFFITPYTAAQKHTTTNS